MYGELPDYPYELGRNCVVSSQRYLDVHPVGFNTLEELTRYVIEQGFDELLLKLAEEMLE
jgi:hypothetical protein